jgi:hypothetical protein
MRVEVTLEQDGKLLDRYEFDSPRGDLISGFAAASTRFRRNHPDLSLADAGVSIRLSRADAAADAAQSAARVTADPI